MKTWPWILVILLSPFTLFAWQMKTPSATQTATETISISHPKPIPDMLVGAGSCAAAACHHANNLQNSSGSEYTIWIAKDRHARAYESLFSQRSERIQKQRHRSQGIPAQDDALCLKCHVDPSFDPQNPPSRAPYFKTDGVSCEACHGPAKDWLESHHLDSWKGLTTQQKRKHGMADTKGIPGRVQVCVGCHVGAPGMDVNHDLIAAGHPRLNFEFTAFHAMMPHHWPTDKDHDPRKSPHGRRDFEAQAWIVGQIASAKTALKLLAARAEEKTAGPWPEFAEFDCFACHHDLRPASWRQERSGAGKVGSMPWSRWYLGMLPLALHAVQADARALEELTRTLGDGWPSKTPRALLAAKTATAAEQLDNLLQKIHDNPPGFVDGTRQESLLEALNKEAVLTGRSWDESSQLCLALSAMSQARADGKTRDAKLQPILKDLFLRLEFPTNYDSPKAVDPEAVRKKILELKNQKR